MPRSYHVSQSSQRKAKFAAKSVKMDSSDDEQISVKARKKVATIDSDASEDESEKVAAPTSASEKSSPLKINDSSDEEDTISKSKKKGAALDSDSDDNEALKIDSSPVKQDENSSSPKKPKKKRAAAFDDSDNSEDENVTNESVSQKLLKNKDLYDAEDSSDDDNESKKNDAKESGSEHGSSSEGELNEEEEMSRIEAETQKMADKKPKKKLQDRKTKEAAMKEIYSESQRMFRQSGIQVGYHRPKQRTLEEFLNRKKKQVIDQVLGDDLKIRKVSVNTAEFERKLEECEKATEEFYKNDDEDDEGVADNEASQESTKASEETEAKQIDQNQEDTEVLAVAKHEDSKVVSECGDTEVAEKDNEDIPNLDDEVNNDKAETMMNEEQTINDSGIVPNCVTPENSNENSNDDNEEVGKDSEPMIVGSKDSEEDSLKLFLEPDTEKFDSDSDDVVPSSQKQDIEQSVSEKTNPYLTKKLQTLAKDFDLQVVKEKLELKPTLGKDMFDGDNIFLEDPEKEEGMDMFLQRFSKHAKAKSTLPPPNAVKKNMNISIIRKETDSKGKEHLKTETIKYKVDLSNVTKAKNVDRPGAQLIALKQTLKQEMFQKRRAEHEKKMQSRENDNDDEEEDEEILEDEDLEDDDEDMEELEESEGEPEPSESDEDTYVNSEKKSRIKSAFLDDEAEEDTDMDKEDYELKLDEDEEELDGNDIPKVTSDIRSTPLTNFEEKDANFRWTPFDERSQSVLGKTEPAAKKKLGFESLFDTSDPQVGDIDDVVGLCSGQFVTQKPLMETQEPSQNDDVGNATPDTVIMTPSQAIESQQISSIDLENISTLKSSTISQKILSSDDEDDDEIQDDNKPKKEKVLKKKKPKRIVMSDSEDDDEDDEYEDTNNVEKEIESDNEQGKEIMYDSEENEIEAPAQYQGFRDGKKGIRREFLEAEAELSGSELGSADEDERGLDRLMQEEGDLDDIDEDDVRDEVGRLHHRAVLDQDKREIRLFQEAFLEDGELHSDNTRQRKFRWKNIDDENIDLSLRNSDDEAAEVEEQTNELDEKRRLERLEREKWIQENEGKLHKKKINGEDLPGRDEIEDDHEDSQFFKTASKAMSKLNMRRSISVESTKQPSIKEFKSPKAKIPLQIISGNKKGSFLTRESQTLEKLAEMTKGKSESKTGTTAKNTNNFVFAAVTPPKKASEDQQKKKKSNKSHQQGPALKKQKFDRTLDENSKNSTIFGLL